MLDLVLDHQHEPQMQYQKPRNSQSTKYAHTKYA